MIPTIICATATLCGIVTALPDFDQVKAQRFAMPKAQEQLLQKDCEAMNAEGKIQDLIGELNKNTEELIGLRMDRLEDRNEYRIRRIQENIHRITTRAKSILRPEWTDSRWPYKTTWNLRFTDVMAIDPKIIETSFAFSDFELQTMTVGGIEREDLYPLVKVTTKREVIQIDIEKSASSLELCQLQSTWAIVGKVKYKFQNKGYARYSELSLRPGAIYLPEPKEEDPAAIFKPHWPVDKKRICEILGGCPGSTWPGLLPKPPRGPLPGVQP